MSRFTSIRDQLVGPLDPWLRGLKVRQRERESAEQGAKIMAYMGSRANKLFNML